ncbi:MAG: DUF4124 domain-containing protein [Ottowia sp.]|nr:DUF4124 domain-containing protein [Ottowia sp.]
MKKIFLPFIAVACVAMSAQAWAIHKCVGANGKPVFQDAPCRGEGQAINVRPASGRAASKPQAAASEEMTEAERINARTEASIRKSRRNELQEFHVPNAQRAIARHRQDCEQRLEALKADQYRYEQNLYGKTHAAQRASEMAAEASSCDRRERELSENLEKLLGECRQLGGCAQ